MTSAIKAQTDLYQDYNYTIRPTRHKGQKTYECQMYCVIEGGKIV